MLDITNTKRKTPAQIWENCTGASFCLNRRELRLIKGTRSEKRLLLLEPTVVDVVSDNGSDHTDCQRTEDAEHNNTSSRAEFCRGV